MKFRISPLFKAAFFVVAVFLVSQEAFAEEVTIYGDTTISSPVDEAIVLGDDNIDLTISGSGDVSNTGGGSYAFSNSGAAAYTNWTINVNAADGKGLYSGYSAISLDSSSGSINLSSGTIKNNSDWAAMQFSNTSLSLNISSGAYLFNSRVDDGGDAVATTSSALQLNSSSSATVNNAGTIYGPNAIYSSLGSLDLTNSGTIYSNVSGFKAIDLKSTSTGTITNSGTITGDISAVSGNMDITNTGTITSNVTLGTNSGSSFTQSSGTTTGNIKMGNASQNVNFSGGSFVGEVDGSSSRLGIINITDDFTLSSSSKFGSTNGVTSLNINDGATFTASGYSDVSNFNILSGGTLTLNSDNMKGTATSLAGTMNFGSTAHTFTGSVTGSGAGTLNLSSASHSLDGALTLNSGDTIGVTFASSGDVGKVTTTGAATVASGVKVNVDLASAYSYITSGSKYVIVSGATGSSLTAIDSSNINLNSTGSNTAFIVLTFTSGITGTDLYLEVARISDTSATQSPNAQNVYNNINSIGSSATGTLASFQSYVDTVNSSSELTAALKSTAPQSDDGIRQTNLNILNNSFLNIENRLDQIRSGYFNSLSDSNVGKSNSTNLSSKANINLQQNPFGLDSEAAYLNSREDYLNIRDSLLKSKTSNPAQEASYLRARDSYLKSQAEFLNSEKSSLDSEVITLKQNPSPTSAEADYLKARDNYLEAISAFLKLENKAPESESAYLKARSNYFVSEKTYLASEKSYLLARADYMKSRDAFLGNQKSAELEKIYSKTGQKFLSEKEIYAKAQKDYFDAKSAYLAAKTEYLENQTIESNNAELVYLNARPNYLTARTKYLKTQINLAESSTNKAKSADQNLISLQQSEASLSPEKLYDKNVNSKSSPNFSDQRYKLKSLGEKSNSNNANLSKNSNLWAHTFGIDARQNNLRGLDGEGYNSNTNGLIIGLDKEFSKRNYAGLAISFASSNIKALDNLKRIGIETYQVSAYSGHVFGKYFLDTIAAFALNDYTSRRSISSVGETANASFSGKSYAARIRGGFVKNLDGNFSLIPETSLTFANNNIDNYSEDGAGTLNLNVRGRQTNFLEGRVGLNLSYKKLTAKGSTINPQLKSSYGYDFIGKRDSLVSNFSGQSTSFVTTGSKYDRTSFRVGGSIDFCRIDMIEFGAEYILEIKSSYKSHTGVLKGKYKF